jgi:hypothetical protein
MTRSCAAPDGFSLTELLIASLMTMAILGAALSIAHRAQHTFESQPEQADVHQRVRVGVEALRQDLVMAGAGTYAGPALGALNSVLSAVMPYRAFGDAPDPAQGTRFRRDVISLMYVPSTAAQSVLSAPLSAGVLDIQIAPAPNCPVATTTQLCGFSAGVRALIVDARGHWDVFRVDQVGSGALTLGHRGAATIVDYPAGSPVAEIKLATYSLKVDTSTGVSQLVRHDGWATELPIADHVVAMHFAYFGEAEPPRLTGAPLDSAGEAATTYGPEPPPIGDTQGSWLPGENCTFRVVDDIHVPRLAVLAGGALAELPPVLLTDGPWCPDPSAQNAFDADLLRVRSVRVTLRVQSAVASLRGPAGTLFLNGGTARGADRYVPDLEVQFDVTPRNLGLGH